MKTILKNIYGRIQGINPGTSIISSLGEYVSHTSQQVAEYELREVIKYLPKNTLAYKIATTSTHFSEKQLWVITYALSRNLEYLNMIDQDDSDKKYESDRKNKIENARRTAKREAISAERKAAGKSKKTYRAEYDSLMAEYKTTKNIDLYKQAKSISKYAF